MPSDTSKHRQAEIGGYLDISANQPKLFHPDGYFFNAARYAFEYILRERHYSFIWLPYYICDTIIKAAERTGTSIRFYSLDKNFYPILPDGCQQDAIFYVNYYGLMDKNVKKLTTIFPKLVIDNAQAFHATPFLGFDTLYSPRKFFALPDGGILVPGTPIAEPNLQQDISFERVAFLYKRLDCMACEGYQESLKAREKIAASGMMKMSKLTSVMMSQLNIDVAFRQRRENWQRLHEKLANKNLVQFELDPCAAPLFYPLIYPHPSLRKLCNNSKIFIPTYWPGVKERVGETSFEHTLYSNMHALPIDQRYGKAEMEYICSTINAL